jgi:hypothetical protein
MRIAAKWISGIADYQQFGGEIEGHNLGGSNPSKRLPAVCRSLTALLLLLGALVVSTATARADSFQITFSGGTGTFTTDGTCVGCIPSHGLLTFVVNLGPDSGAQAFDITDDVGGQFTSYNRMVNTIGYAAINSETGDGLSMSTGGAGTNTWGFLSAAQQSFTGTYEITPVTAPVPEPSSITLLLPGFVALVGFFSRRKLLTS